MFFNNQFFINMPKSYICKQIENEISLGTSAENVVDFLKSHKDWTNGEYYGDLYDYQIYNDGIDINDFNTGSYYSLSSINYKSEQSEKIGSFLIFCDLGSAPIFEPFWGNEVNAYFVFDEEQKLIDIIVHKRPIGF